MKSAWPLLALLLLIASHCTVAAHRAALAAAGSGAAADRAKRGQPNYRRGEVLIQLKPGVNPDNVLKQLKAQKKRVLKRPKQPKRGGKSLGEGELMLVQVPSSMDVEQAVKQLSSMDSTVQYAEPNFEYKPALIPNDPWFNSAWGLKGAPGVFGSQASTAWDTVTDCSSVYVAVVDEGIFYNHADLSPNIWINDGEVPGDGIDNDGNGFIDDVRGYDFYNKKGDVYSAADGDDHGTQVAGIIGATGNNGIGVPGMCHQIKIISAKFMGSAGGTTADAILALNYITDLKVNKGLNIVATSNSWSCGTSCFSQSLLDAINRGHAAGILFIAAAGNNATSTLSYPAAYASPAVISVAAIQSDGSLLPTSNRGSTWVHLGAPGAGIPTTTVNNGYVSNSGTSMAAPHVTGAAALYKAYYPYATHTEIRNAILSSVTPTTSLQNGATSTGGRLNAAAMLAVVPNAACTWKCDAAQYCSADSDYCEWCPPNCADCTSPTSCTSCLPGWTGATCSTQLCPTAPCTSKQFCQSSTTTSGTTLRCVSCPTNCNTCTSLTQCTSCVTGFGGATCSCRVKGQSCTANSQCCTGRCSSGKCA